MTRPKHLFVFALTTTLLAGASVRADVIKWDYSWTMSPASGKVKADAPGKGKVAFDLENPGVGANNSDISAANLRTISKATEANPDKFQTGGFYTLTLMLTDEKSGLSGAVTFSGKLNGTFSALSADVENVFLGDTSKTLELGNNHYVVSIGPYTPPGPPSSDNRGSIGAHVNVTHVGIRDVPEPSTLVLSCLGGTAFIGFSVRRLRKKLTLA